MKNEDNLYKIYKMAQTTQYRLMTFGKLDKIVENYNRKVRDVLRGDEESNAINE